MTLAKELSALGIFVSPNTVARLLHQMGFSLRVNAKLIATSQSPDRERQFAYLTDLRTRFQRQHANTNTPTSPLGARTAPRI